MIELTLEQLLNSVDSLKQLSNRPVKARLAYMAAKIIKEADVEVANFNEARLKLINQYSEKDENGTIKTDEKNNVLLIPDKINDFNSELSDLLNTQIVFNTNKLKMEDLDELEFTPNEIITLEPFIEM